MFEMFKTCPFKGLATDNSACPMKSHCTEKNNTSSASTCPVGHGKSNGTCPISSNKADSKSIACPVDGKLTGEECKTGECPIPKNVATSAVPTSQPAAECPMGHKNGPLKYNAKASDLEFNSLPLPGQTEKLSAERITSTIPKGSETPSHQNGSPANSGNWVYPSEQQYYNAIRKKGYDFVEPKDIPHTLAIHNSVNEQGWLHIRRWEALRGNMNPVLKSMQGKPDELSWKARINSTLFG